MVCLEDGERLIFLSVLVFYVLSKIGWMVEILDVRVLCEHSAAWISVDVSAAIWSYSYSFTSLGENVREHFRFEGHFPLVLEVAGSRVAAVRAAKATRSLKCILMSLCSCGL